MQDGRNVPVADVLRRVSAHLDVLASDVHALEHSVGDQLDTRSETTGQTITQLQRLDFLRQSLEDLALLNLFMAETCNGLVPETTTKRLRLESTRDLLVPDTKGDPSRQNEGSVGEVDLFS